MILRPFARCTKSFKKVTYYVSLVWKALQSPKADPIGAFFSSIAIPSAPETTRYTRIFTDCVRSQIPLSEYQRSIFEHAQPIKTSLSGTSARDCSGPISTKRDPQRGPIRLYWACREGELKDIRTQQFFQVHLKNKAKVNSNVKKEQNRCPYLFLWQQSTAT